MKNWFETYQLIAELLNGFYQKHGDNSPNELLQLLNSDEEYRINNNWLKNAVEKYEAKGIDPIQLFASFNNSSSNITNKIKRINLLFSAIGSPIKIEYSPNFFDDCPSPMTVRLINARNLESQNEIWKVFSSAFNYGIKGLGRNDFDLMRGWFGINFTGFTIFLFWIDSEKFLPMDQNTVTFLVASGVVEKRPDHFDAYQALCSYKGDKDLFRAIVKLAYASIKGKDDLLLFPAEVSKFMHHFKPDSTQDEIKSELKVIAQNFKIIAIRPKQKENRIDAKDKQKHLKNLKEDDLYNFYKSYEFKDNETIVYTEGIENHLYNLDGIKVSISAVVGKNGSGKSTITELLFLAINRLALEYVTQPEYELINEEIFMDLFFLSDRLYKFEIGKQINLFSYSFDSEKKEFNKPEKVQEGTFDFQSFFYSIAVNYSLYALNKKIIGNWIDPLFQKNDGYQVPIVLNPKRNNGNIEVNTEEDLAKSRCLANILDPDRIDFDNGLVPPLVENKIPLTLKCKLYEDKIDSIIVELGAYEISDKRIDKEIDKLLSHLNITGVNVIFIDEAKRYIFRKLINICYYYGHKYGKFIKFKDQKFIKFNQVTTYIDELIEDKSHVTFKLKQALNYLKYGHILCSKGDNSNNILALSGKIQKIQKEAFEHDQTEIPVIELIPPAFFKTNIFFNDKSDFESLSSGEKQSIFSINTVAYHLINLNSVETKGNLMKYNYVNILFDEVELYFHPDMQRTFIWDLLAFIGNLKLDAIAGINILFATHSPFILSDLPDQNVLKLIDGIPQFAKSNEQTFGANIHDLLANDFFMEEGFMGEFAKNEIRSLIAFLDRDENPENKWNKENSHEIIDIVGEPVLHDGLRRLYFEKFKDEETIRKEIDRLTQKIAK